MRLGQSPPGANGAIPDHWSVSESMTTATVLVLVTVTSNGTAAPAAGAVSDLEYPPTPSALLSLFTVMVISGCGGGLGGVFTVEIDEAVAVLAGLATSCTVEMIVLTRLWPTGGA